MQAPEVSVIVPVKDGEATIGACLDSLAALDFEKDRFEVLVVDNGSTDRTREIIAEHYPFHLLDEAAKGSYAARNAGVRAARGKFLAFTDADCVVDRQWLSSGLKAFKDSAVGGVAGAVRGLEAATLVEEYQTLHSPVAQENMIRHPFLPYALTANAIYRRSVFDAIGPFEAGWISGGDADFSWRMQMETKKKLAFADDALVYHRHRADPQGLFSQCRKNVIGACLLNRKYKGKFEYIAEPTSPRLLDVKIAANRLKSVVSLAGYRLTRRKEHYFHYLRKVGRMGYLQGYRDFVSVP